MLTLHASLGSLQRVDLLLFLPFARLADLALVVFQKLDGVESESLETLNDIGAGSRIAVGVSFAFADIDRRSKIQALVIDSQDKLLPVFLDRLDHHVGISAKTIIHAETPVTMIARCIAIPIGW